MTLLVTGSIAYDSLKTPYGERKKILGGSASHAAVAASLFSKEVKLLGIVGSDFKYLDFFKKRKIDISGIEIKQDGKTFHWEGYYEGDMAEAFTVQTDLNVFGDFKPKIPTNYLKSDYLFLGNMDPDIQLEILKKVKPKFSAMDTMNFWIASKKKELMKVIKNVDMLFINSQELCELMQEPNLIKAARLLIKRGGRYLIVKKGEHGAMLFHKNEITLVPAYPLELLKDPTGAGDSFAGGVMGYLCAQGNNDYKAIKTSLLFGTAVASYMVQDFSSNKLLTIAKKDINQRVNELKKILTY